jgi:RNA-directed DNA polymerase
MHSAVEMSREGISLIVIQRQLGHADLAITSRYLRGIDNTEIIAAIGKLDHYLWQLTLKWAKFNHSTKPTYWAIARYFGKFSKARQDRSAFGNRTSGAFLHRFALTDIVRHPIVKHAASPDVPELADYWTWRRRKAPLPINRTALRLHWNQDGRYAICKTTLLAASEGPQTPRDREHWQATTRKTIDVVWDTATSDEVEPRLIHLHCDPTRQPPRLA